MNKNDRKEITNPDTKNDALNENHKRHLLVSCQHIDKLLSDIEAILNAANSNSPFPKYTSDLAPVQQKLTRDYIARLRKQLVRVLESQNIRHRGASVSSIFAIHTVLSFISISIEELQPKKMRGYGEIGASGQSDLSGIAGELGSIVSELDSYLMSGLGQDFQGRLERLTGETGDEIGLLKNIERVIAGRGLVQFRAPLSIILERLEEKRFEIAFFGRVSAGKSSLLNRILQTDLLPVGANPITAVPTRILYGESPRLIVRFAGKKEEIYGIEKLADFAAEQRNSGNAKNVVRLSVELPAARLRDGVVLVDTPGLGSLAAGGAAETIAYLPRCDLGVVLIDAASTLTAEDLLTIQTLYEAAIPALVLLSKADLLQPAERAETLRYIENNVKTNLGVNLAARAVSTVGENASLTDEWFEQEIVPLFNRHGELARESIRRKIKSLGEAVAAALKLKLEKDERENALSGENLKEIEIVLRHTAGRFEETRAACLKFLDKIPHLAPEIIEQTAAEIVERWASASEKNEFDAVLDLVIFRVTADAAGKIYDSLKMLLESSEHALDEAAKSLGMESSVSGMEHADVLREMPRFEIVAAPLDLQVSLLMIFGKSAARRRVEAKLKKQIGASLFEALMNYRRILQTWISNAVSELERGFNSRAAEYRTRIETFAGDNELTAGEEENIRRDIESLKIKNENIAA